MKKLNCIPLPSCCEASPARPSRGSSSPLPSAIGFSCGIPVAEAMIAYEVPISGNAKEEEIKLVVEGTM